MFDVTTATDAELTAQFNQDLVKVIKLAPERNIGVKADELNAIIKEMGEIADQQAKNAAGVTP